MEAAQEIARQVRLRDLGGLIVVDFIDVLQPENKDKIHLELKKEFHKDRAISKIEKMILSMVNWLFILLVNPLLKIIVPRNFN